MMNEAEEVQYVELGSMAPFLDGASHSSVLSQFTQEHDQSGWFRKLRREVWG